MGLDRRARGGGGARGWRLGADESYRGACKGLGFRCCGGNRMQGLGLLVLRWKQDAGAWVVGVVVETGSEGAASVATEGGGGEGCW